MNSVRTVTKLLFQRYLPMIPSEGNASHDLTFVQLKVLCQQGIELSDTLPIDKLSRWLGYIQCTLNIHQITDIDTERSYSRPLFHEAYRIAEIAIPATVDVRAQ